MRNSLEVARGAPPEDLTGTASVTLSDRPTSLPRVGTDYARFTLVAAELGLLVLIIRLFEVEGKGFGNLAVLTWAGFVVHHFLPLRLRLPFFVALSLTGLTLIAGWQVAASVTGGGLLLIGACHLPIRFALRVGILLLLGCLLACLRVGWLRGGAATAEVDAILSSLFMFRLIVYMYDLRHNAAPFSAYWAGAYFFMLPNVCFPLFPVVDYKTFCSTHFNAAPLGIYQSGLRWIVRGIVQLLLYRLVYQIGLVDPMQVTDLGGVARFMVATYLLYLRVSGQFHLIVGMLHLFGFNLPETHHRYLLASSFTDFWRRINIYWKDFIMKIFFYPAYFQLKRLGPTLALVVATLYAFFATWALHSYQWFWLRGSFLLAWQDMVFWSVLAGLVLANALWEAKWGRRRTLTRARPTLRSQVLLALCTAGTFVAICTLWTVWNCESLDELAWLLSAARHATPGDVFLILAGLVALGVAAVVSGHSTAERTEGRLGATPPQEERSFLRAALGVGLACGGLLILAALTQAKSLENGPAADLLAAVQKDQLNRIDVDTLRRGYYEKLDVARRQVELWRLRVSTPPGWEAGRDQLVRLTHDFRYEELVPSVKAFSHDRWITHNRYGMRGRETDKAKPSGVVRIALFGSSHEYGYGVDDHEPYGNVLEDLLNREAAGSTPRYELLNFAQENHGIYQSLRVLETKAFDFDPDVVLLAINAGEFRINADHLTRVIRSGCDIPFDGLRSIVDQSGADRSMSESLIKAKLAPYASEMVRHAFQRLRAECGRRGIAVYAVFRPYTYKWSNDAAQDQAENKRRLLELAEETSLTVIDLSPAFDRIKNRSELMVAPWDDHCNARAHRFLADELFRALHDREGHCLLRPRAGTAAPGAL